MGTWHWRHRARSGWVVRIGSRAAGPVWQAAQFSRMKTRWGIRGGETGLRRSPRRRSWRSGTKSVATKTSSVREKTWHWRQRLMSLIPAVSACGEGGA